MPADLLSVLMLILLNAADLVQRIGPYVLVGITLATLLSRVIHRQFWQVLLRVPRPLAMPLAGLLGVVSPLPTTSAVPVMVCLRSEGLADSVTLAFVLASSLMNPQVGFGDDVISRISRVREDHGALSQIQHTVLKAFNALIQELTGQAGVAARHIYEIVIAGNSTMQQMFCGLDTSALGEMPFVQVFDSSLSSLKSAALSEVTPYQGCLQPGWTKPVSRPFLSISARTGRSFFHITAGFRQRPQPRVRPSRERVSCRECVPPPGLLRKS